MENKHVLEDALTYLIGPIENVPDDGIVIRQQIIEKLKEYDIRVKVIDPTQKPCSTGHEIGPEKAKINALIDAEKYQEAKNLISDVRHIDLRFIDLVDFVIMYIDPSVHMCGSYNEAFEAERQHKPRFVIVKGGIKKLPRWMFDVFDLDNIFDSVDTLVDKLDKLNRGIEPLTSQWVLIRKFI